MSIRFRIALLVLSVFVALAAIGGFAIHRAQLSADEVKSVTTGVVPDAIEAIKLMEQLKDVQIAALSMVNESASSAIANRHREIAERKATLQASLRALAASARSEAEKGLAQQALDGLANYFQSIDDTAQFALAGQRDLAEANLAATVDQYLREQGEIMQTLQVERTRNKDDAIDHLNTMLSRTTVTLGAATLLAAVISMVIGWLLQRQVVRPIAAMERRMTDIATHHDYSLRMPVERADEIGRSVIAFNAMLAKIEASAAEVRSKNANIRAMLQALPEGILTLEAGGCIHPEYSAHLTTILGDQAFAGMNVMHAVFARSQLSDDERDALEAALGACIGEDRMNFDFNAHLLPTEIRWQQDDSCEAKILELCWEPMVDEQDTIQRILLTLRDITDMRSLAQAAAQQARELTMISEILALPADKFSGFLAQTIPDLERMHTLLAQAQTETAPALSLVTHLFRLMHTIKGNARTLGLKTLANAAHLAEDSYERWRQGDEPIDVSRAQHELAEVRALTDAYQHLHGEKLGRNQTMQTGALSLGELQQISVLARTARAHATPAAQAALDEALDIMARAECMTVREVLLPIQAGLAEVAVQLGKPAPDVQLTGDDILLRKPAEKALTGALNHLLRNAVDHGLESATERQQAHKPERGQISVHAMLDEQTLTLTLADDGRGLNLERIRAKALAQGLLTEADLADPDAIAQCIFAPGFSTAAQVSDISGRGVGMDAVKADIEALRGTIRLQLAPVAAPNGFAPFTTVISLSASLAFVSHLSASAEPQRVEVTDVE